MPINKLKPMNSEPDFSLDSNPGNDVYPYMYSKSKDSDQEQNQNNRFRRNLWRGIKVKNEGKSGELQSNGEKYPDRFKSKRSDNSDVIAEDQQSTVADPDSNNEKYPDKFKRSDNSDVLVENKQSTVSDTDTTNEKDLDGFKNKRSDHSDLLADIQQSAVTDEYFTNFIGRDSTETKISERSIPKREIYINQDDESIMNKFIEDPSLSKPILVQIVRHNEDSDDVQNVHSDTTYASLSRRNGVMELAHEQEYDNFDHNRPDKETENSAEILKKLLDTNAKVLDFQPIRFSDKSSFFNDGKFETNTMEQIAENNHPDSYIHKNQYNQNENILNYPKPNQIIHSNGQNGLQEAYPLNIPSPQAIINAPNQEKINRENIPILPENNPTQDYGNNQQISPVYQSYPNNQNVEDSKHQLLGSKDDHKETNLEQMSDTKEPITSFIQIAPNKNVDDRNFNGMNVAIADNSSDKFKSRLEQDIKPQRIANGCKFPDMSNYWTNFEKQQIEKGIEKAQGQDNEDKAKAIVMAMNLKEANELTTEVKEKGFETVDSVTLDSISKFEASNNVEKRLDPSLSKFRSSADSEYLKESNNIPIKNSNYMNPDMIKEKLGNPPEYSSIILEPKVNENIPAHLNRPYSKSMPYQNQANYGDRSKLISDNIDMDDNIMKRPIEENYLNKDNSDLNNNNFPDNSVQKDNFEFTPQEFSTIYNQEFPSFEPIQNFDTNPNNENLNVLDNDLNKYQTPKQSLYNYYQDNNFSPNPYNNNNYYNYFPPDPNFAKQYNSPPDENKILENQMIEESIQEVLPNYKNNYKHAYNYKRNQNIPQKRFIKIPPRIFRTHGRIMQTSAPEVNVDDLLDDLRDVAKTIKKHNYQIRQDNDIDNRVKKNADVVLAKPKKGKGINPGSEALLPQIIEINENNMDAPEETNLKNDHDSINDENIENKPTDVHLTRQLKSVINNFNNKHITESDMAQFGLTSFKYSPESMEYNWNEPVKSAKLKIRAEGDYGDEEDSTKEKSDKIKVIKKTQNKFSNPSRPLDSMEDYIYDDINKSSMKSPKFSTEMAEIVESPDEKEDIKYFELPVDVKSLSEDASFAHHRQKLFKEKFKRTTAKPNYPHPIISSQLYETPPTTLSYITTTSKPDSTSAEAWKHFQRDVESESEDADFKHWPKYVVDDMNKREQIKKRSLTKAKKSETTITLPSENNFFVRRESREQSTCKGLPKASSTNQFTRKKNATSTSTTSSTTTPDSLETIIPMDEDDEDDDKSSEQDTLNDFLNGDVGINIIKTVNENIENNNKLKKKYHMVQSSHQVSDLCTTEKTALTVTPRQPQEIMLAKKLLESVSKILHSYIINFKVQEVKTKVACKDLTVSLKDYLNNLLIVPKCDNPLEKSRDMEEAEAEEPTQSPFLFKLENNQVVVEHKKQKDLNNKVNILRQLLAKYDKLPDKCKIRAKPVKEYIQKHLQLLKKIDDTSNSVGSKSYDVDESFTVPDNVDSIITDVSIEKDPVEQQLESVGLGMKQEEFQPNFNLDEMMDTHTTISQRAAVDKRDIQVGTRLPTKRFLKLFDAVRHLRQRRESEERIGELYAKKPTPKTKNHAENEDLQQYSSANFESPLVYSL